MTETEKLLEKYLNGTCTEDERKKVDGWFEAHEVASSQWESMPEAEKPLWLKTLQQDINLEIMRRELQVQSRSSNRSRFIWMAAAALAFLMLSVGMWVWSYRNEKAAPAATYSSDVAPGKNGATITLANGKVIQLSDQKTGVVIGSSLKYSDGSIVQQHSVSPSALQGAEGKAQESIPQYLTAETSKGQTYQFTLPDGTKVWLNADSKISFPSQFNGKERKILLSGEAYFAVVHNAKQPFRVESKQADGTAQVVEDIGTEFNINAYPDEASTRTTLIEGSAKVNAITLHPNQQATNSGSNIKVAQVDTEEAIAWKNGLFRFNDENIESIMKKLERWYNIEVVYEREASSEGFTGKISRNNNISEVLLMLQQTKGVKFKVAGRRVTIIR